MENNLRVNINDFYVLRVLQAFDYDLRASKALELISQQLTDDLFNFIEPSFFEFNFLVFKTFDDSVILPENQSVNITMNKIDLLHKNNDVIIQVFEDKKVLLWENIDYLDIFSHDDVLIYKYYENKESFFAKKQEIGISHKSGSQFSNEFSELEEQLSNYKLHKIRHSSCPIFNEAWHSDKRIFFKGGGKDIPEKFMQESLHNFLKDMSIFKGEIGQLESTREHNLDASKPVDIIVRWEKSNRIALIEIKWLGKSLQDNEFKSTHSNARAVEGFVQLKDYFELAKKDYPYKIIKCYLVVIDGRRWQTNESTVSITRVNGLHYANQEIVFEDDKTFHKHYKNFAEPIRMFVEPICS